MVAKLYEKPDNLGDMIADWQEPQLNEGGKGILKERYLIKDEHRNPIETPKELFYRVASVISDSDVKYGDFDPEKTKREFYDLMVNRMFFPNSPTLKGAGLGINLSACYVLPVEDTRQGIFGTLGDAVEVQAHGGGTGFNFSELRPKDSLISSTNGRSSGPVPFMEVFDVAIGRTIAQGGTRQGANMAILDYNHGDIRRFIASKGELSGPNSMLIRKVEERFQDLGLKNYQPYLEVFTDKLLKMTQLTNFNLSVGVIEDFFRMLEDGGEYPLIDHKGREMESVRAEEIFDSMVHYAWDVGCPGIVFIDRINADNPTPHKGIIVATNPCGEQPLLPNDACNLGSINLRKFVKGDRVDYDGLGRVVHQAVHFLDNVIDANKYPLPKIEEMVMGNRRIGLGIMGWANTLASFGMTYGSDESCDLAEKIQGFITNEAENASVNLAKIRGVFPNWDGSIYDPSSEHFRGRELRIRNSARVTIAPTGTLSNLAGVEGGIEPYFGLAYTRKSVFDEKGEAKLEFPVVHQELEEALKAGGVGDDVIKVLANDIIGNKGVLAGIVKPEGINEGLWGRVNNIFVTSHEIPYQNHIMMQAAFQRNVDNAVSKTINLPYDATEDDVRNAYMMAYKEGLKGITVFRDGCKGDQPLSLEGERLVRVDRSERPSVMGPTVKQKSPHGTAFITLNYPTEDLETLDQPYESFIAVGKAGKDINAIAEGYGRLLSLAFKHGITLEEVVEQLAGISGETQLGFGEERISSLPHAIGAGLIQAYSQLKEKFGNGKEDVKREEKSTFSGNFCPDCGSHLHMKEGCQKCSSSHCGYSKC